MEHVNFTSAKLENADLSEALLYSANLSMAHLKEVYLRGAVLENVSLREAQDEQLKGQRSPCLHARLVTIEVEALQSRDQARFYR